jgi:putative FmdB family regulatory protein
MPTYDYKCEVCDKEFEAMQSIRDEPCAECPVCHVASHKRLISGRTGFVLKGGGWAADNYSKKS